MIVGGVGYGGAAEDGGRGGRKSVVQDTPKGARGDEWKR